jgi:four helix bundle protein
LGEEAYERSFISKLTDADGEQYETQHWLETAADCGYLNEAELRDLLGRCQRIGKLLGGMIEKADLFCGELTTNMREPAVEYFVSRHKE